MAFGRDERGQNLVHADERLAQRTRLREVQGVARRGHEVPAAQAVRGPRLACLAQIHQPVVDCDLDEHAGWESWPAVWPAECHGGVDPRGHVRGPAADDLEPNAVRSCKAIGHDHSQRAQVDAQGEGAG
jgi:hypothetical protein